MDKQKIFDNIDMYSAEEIVNFIKNGYVTAAELEDVNNTNGMYEASVKKRVNFLLENAEPNDWNSAKQANTVVAYEGYIRAYPNGVHKIEAEQAIENLRREDDDADWANALETGTEEAFQEYLNTHQTGKHRDEARKKKAEVKNSSKRAEEKSAWDGVDKENLKALRKFVSEYSSSIYCNEANRLINKLVIRPYIPYGMSALMEDVNNAVTPDERYELIKKALDDETITIDDIFDGLEDDHNAFRADDLRRLIVGGYFSYEDLEDLDISRDFIRQMAKNNYKIRFDKSPRDFNITSNSTEIYFWGIPSSGKTCALGAILSVAQSGRVALSMTPDTDCQGFVYMNKLPQCFRITNDVVVLPEGTPKSSSYEMRFDLEDGKHKIHPITCYDFAGEMIRCMYKKQAGETLTVDEEKTLRSLTDVLGGKDENGKPIGRRTDNRKIHFFVVEYGAENRRYDGLPQINYLVSALEYIKKTGIFHSNTDAIFLIVTKVDKIKASNEEERKQRLSQYVNTHYAAFFNGLKQICRKEQINGGEVPVLPFSLGEVCFQDFCKLNPRYAIDIVNIILKRSPSYSTGWWGWLKKMFGL